VEKNSRKKLTKKKLWTFEWPKMSHIFIELPQFILPPKALQKKYKAILT
jgi:hypothetical protein